MNDFLIETSTGRFLTTPRTTIALESRILRRFVVVRTTLIFLLLAVFKAGQLPTCVALNHFRRRRRLW